MSPESLITLLNGVASGKIKIDVAAKKLTNISSEEINCANIDHNRSLRKGFPEVIFGLGKTTAQIIEIMDRMVIQEKIILITRVNNKKANDLLKRFPDIKYHKDAKMMVWLKLDTVLKTRGSIIILTAGTSDIPVAREAYLTAQAMGNRVETIFDVGVAGIHRLFKYREKIESARVLIVVAGMEGALPSVVAGMVKSPVIAVPTSIGYGTSFGGMTALLGMLNSCSSNIAVVNIDNGFGAGFMASTINQL